MSMENLGPYTNFHELNQDWFLSEFNNLVEQWKAMHKNFDSLQDAFNDLKSYVQEYFKNLNVQDEINNKLDAMKESGELSDIILSALTTVNTNAFLFIGDSYAEGYTPDGIVKNWCDITKELCNIPNNNFYKYYHGGYGFTTGNASFISLLNNAINDLTDQEKKNIKYIIVGGGFNDAYNTTNIEINIKAFIDLARNNFKNATVVLAPFGWCCESKVSSEHSKINYTMLINMIKKYQHVNRYGGCYIPNIEVSLHNNNFFANDYVHPNENGQYQIAYLISNWINARGFSTSEYMSNIGISAELDSFTGDVDFNYTVENNITTLTLSKFNIKSDAKNIKCNGSDTVIGKVISSGIYGKNAIVIPATFIVKNNNLFYTVAGTVKIIDQTLSIQLFATTNEKTNFLTLDSVTEINIYNLHTTAFNSLTQ